MLDYFYYQKMKDYDSKFFFLFKIFNAELSNPYAAITSKKFCSSPAIFEFIL